MRATILFSLILLSFGLQAQSYYGYVEGEAANQINWAEMGNNMNSSLQDARRIKEERVKALGWDSLAQYQAAMKRRRVEERRKTQLNNQKLKKQSIEQRRKLKLEKIEYRQSKKKAKGKV